MKKEPWQIAAARYCVDNSENGFTKSELETHLHKKYQLLDYQIHQFFEEEIQNPAGRIHGRTKIARRDTNQEFVFTAPLELVQKITDYEELKFARESASKAASYSRVAIAIALASLLASVLTPFMFTAKVEIINLSEILQKPYQMAQ